MMLNSSSHPVNRFAAGLSLAAFLFSGVASADDAVKQAANDRVASDVAKVEQAYLVGPTIAAKLGCSIAWQANIAVPTAHNIVLVTARPSGVLALNSRNELTLIRSESGDRAWTVSVAEPVDQVKMVELIDSETTGRGGRVSVVADTGVYGYDLENGNGLRKGRLRHAPSTAPRFNGNMIIYGSRGGHVVWLDGSTGFLFKASAVDSAHLNTSAIPATPAIGEGVIVAGSRVGTVAAFGLGSGSSMWRRDLLGGVVASPTIANGIAFVASEDQYLYAFDLSSGETLWKYFTQSPLTTSPFAAEGLVIQNIPSEGTVAFTQHPEGQIGGEVRWKQQGIEGTPVTVAGLNGRNVIVYWSEALRQITFVDALKGDIAGTLALPQVEHLQANTMEHGGFVLWGADGRIERLSPLPATTRSQPATTEAAPAPAAAEADSNG